MKEECMSLDEIAKYIPKNKLGKEMYECIQSVPPRFREDAYSSIEYCEDFKTLNTCWDLFVEDIYQEMTLDERVEYGFTTSHTYNFEKLAQRITTNIILKNRNSKNKISKEKINNEYKKTVISFEEDIKELVINDLKLKNYEVI